MWSGDLPEGVVLDPLETLQQKHDDVEAVKAALVARPDLLNAVICMILFSSSVLIFNVIAYSN